MMLADAPAMNGPAVWWLVALDTPTAWWCAAVAVFCAVMSAWLLVRLKQLGVAQVARRRAARKTGSRGRFGDAGTATLEFALVFPVLLVLVLTLIQTTLVFTGNLFVHYAAFSATRAAIVQVPRDVGSEDANRVVGQSSLKLEEVRRAAVMAMLPVSGPGTSDRASLVPAISELYTAQGQQTPLWAENLLDQRFGYADTHTDVTIQAVRGGIDAVFADASPGNGEAFGPRDPVAVQVEHRFHLSVPFAGRVFSDGTHATAGGTTRYATIKARFILTNEGVVDKLPDEPAVPRRDGSSP